MNRFLTKSLLTLSLALIGSEAVASVEASNTPFLGGRDYAVAVSRPNNLIVVDLKEEKVVRNCQLNGEAAPIGIVLSPDNSVGYVITDYAGSINGYDLESCKQVFHAAVSTPQTQGKSLSALAVSMDNKQVYVVANQTAIKQDRYEVKDPLFMVFNTADGLDAKAVKTYKAPRQVTVMSTADDGSIFVAGSQIYKVDPKVGDFKVVKKIIGWNKKGYSNPDSAATYPIGQTTRELTVMYTAYKFKDKTENYDTAELFWGLTRIDLKTGKITQDEFNPYETLMFTSMTNPKDSNMLYGVLTDLSKFDLKKKKLIKRVDVDHTYYSVGMASDGKKLYLGSTLNDIAVYDTQTLDKLGNIKLPAGDMGTASFHVFYRP